MSLVSLKLTQKVSALSNGLATEHLLFSQYVGIPNCLTIASTSYKNCFQYTGVPLTELIKENALSLATKFSIIALKLFLTIPAIGGPGWILCIAKIIDERKWRCSYTDLAKKI